MLRICMVVLGLIVFDQSSGSVLNHENLLQRIKRSPHYWEPPPPPPPPPPPYWGPPGPPHRGPPGLPPHWGPPGPPPHWGQPGPPPHWGPPGGPPHWRHHHHHHHSGEDHNEYNTKETRIYEKETIVKGENNFGKSGVGYPSANIAQSNGIGFGQNNAGQSNPALEFGHGNAQLVDETQSIPLDQGNPGFVYQGNIGPGNPHCETCKGKSTAVSNAQSVSGSAVAIAVSKSSKF